MEVIKFDGGPLMGIDRASISQWGGVFHKSFFGTDSKFENDYEEMCAYLNGRGTEELSIIKGGEAEAIVIGIPLPTFIVEADDTSIHLAQIWSSEQGWSESSLTMDDFRSATDWQGDVEFFCGGGEFLIFDSSCPGSSIEEHLSVFLERGIYRCESCYQKRKGQARILLIRIFKQP